MFLKLDAGSSTSASGLRYWFDDDASSLTEVERLSGQHVFDVSALSDGMHTVHCQIMNADGTSGAPVSSMFLKLDAGSSTSASGLRYWFDDDASTLTEAESLTGQQVLDVSALSDGMHTVHYQIMNVDGTSGAPVSSMFLKLGAGSSTSASGLRYWFDDDASSLKETDKLSGLYTFDVSDLQAGLHTLNCQVIDSQGKLSAPVARFFVKNFGDIAEGTNRIIKYQYWLNQNSQAMKTVITENISDPYTLIDLLPLQRENIQSSLFHFEITDNEATIYAKNVFHIRFYDARGYFSDAHHAFVDYSVGEKVEDTADIKKTQTFARPEENGIKWFTLQACEGDTIAFCSSQALSLQVFSPSGEEIYSTSEAESVKWGGCHTWENGTYYVAVHDVTGSRPDVTLEYMHMDKYDVVDWNVRKVGNGGCSTITFQGNGFKDLYAVDLFTANGDTIDAKAIHHESDATVNVTFDFTDKTISKYDAVFHFTTEDRKFTDMLTVEEAKDITLDLNVQYPSTFLRGTSVTYTIAVTNNGNATAYDVPLELRLRSGRAFSEIESVRFTDDEGKEFNNFTLEGLDRDSIDEETLAFLEEELKTLGSINTFIVVNDSVENEELGFTDLYLTIAPKETSVFNVTLKSNSALTLEATIPSEWITINTRMNSVQKSNGMMRSASSNAFCCVKEKVECTVSILANLAGFAPVVGCIPGAVAGVIDLGVYTMSEIACADGHSLGGKAQDFFNSVANDSKKQEDLIGKCVSVILGCVAGAFGKILKKLQDELAAVVKRIKKLNDEIQEAKKNEKTARSLHEYYLSVIEEEKILGNQTKVDEYTKMANSAWEEVGKYAREGADKTNELSELNAKKLGLEKQIGVEKLNYKERVEKICNGIQTIMGLDCLKEWKKKKPNCPPKPKGGGGLSTPVNSYDPNEIYGYLSPSGSKFFAKDSVEAVDYRIEFENDTAFATSAAHVVEIIDTLNADFFELSTFEPTYFNIGDKRELLDGNPNFVRTVDMRPKTNVIVQVEGQYDEKKGIARWLFTSLDPMTMEPTDDVMQGFLPVNHDGTSGIGDVGYRIGVKKGLEDGLEITNRASIVFDANEPILTPTWTNIVDGVCPESTITEITYKNDSIVTLNIEGNDERSGVWKYDLYVQYGVGSPWMKEGELNADSTQVDYKVHDGLYYGFCVLATDSAGNMEQKELRPEVMCADIHLGDVNSDGEVNSLDASLVMAYYLEEPVSLLLAAADVNEDGEVNTLDATLIIQMYLNSEQKKESAPKLKQLFKIQK